MCVRFGKLWLIAAAVGLFSNCPTLASAKAVYLKTPHFTVSYENLSEEDARSFLAAAEEARSTVTAYLGKRFSQPIHIKVGEQYLFPQYSQKESEIFMPANRLRKGTAQPTRSRNRSPLLLMLITPIVAPSTNSIWGEFLETGLRVFLQEKFGASEERAFPMLGNDLHKETARLGADYGRLIPIADVERARTWRTKMTRTRRLAYLEAGSFVRFLIEQYSLEKFMSWYDGKRFEEVYGQEIAQMEREWAGYIRAAQP